MGLGRVAEGSPLRGDRVGGSNKAARAGTRATSSELDARSRPIALPSMPTGKRGPRDRATATVAHAALTELTGAALSRDSAFVRAED